jgi:hypothetical protein
VNEHLGVSEQFGDKKAQRALAAILEVSVEFADVQRRIADAELVLSRLV